jgi:hypothetical protein
MKIRNCGICSVEYTPKPTNSILGPSPYCRKCNNLAYYKAWGTRTVAHPIGVGGMVNGS